MPETTTHAPLGIGDTCYSQHGQQATLIARAGAAYIVSPVYEDDDGEHAGEIETWNTAFRTPPSPKLDKETAAAETRLASIRAQVSALEMEKYTLERDSKARMERLKQHEALADLDRYLAGEITHYVATHGYYPRVEIIPIGETVENYHSSDGYGLLTLMPTRTWDKRLVFSVYFRNQNRNAYNHTRTEQVVPCCGEEDAKAKAAEILAGFVADYLTKEPAKRSYVQELIDCCGVHGVPVPQQLIEDHIEQGRKNLQQQREKALKDLAEIDAKLATPPTA